ncbi:MAG TPA: hypothetical protein VHK91_00890, partial [Flavisolibacter sp.]|nr:hypothetical protein [Flavisolibacter sp.]
MESRSDLRQKHKESGMAAILLLTGFIVGTLDASAAVLRYTLKTGQNPVRIFKYIASGVFGERALNGGMAMAFWGLFFHYIIAFCFTIFFFFIYPVLFRWIRNKVLTGLLYGLFIWVLMNLVIVPLSAT